MIGRLQGKLLEKQPPLLLVDVGGVAYEVLAPMTTFYRLSDNVETITLHTHLAVREDAQVLYGFSYRYERELFRDLIKVNGVGPRMALGLLSGMEAEELVETVRFGDTATLVKIPGVGKKTAERLIIDMRDRLKDWSIDTPQGNSVSTVAPQSSIQTTPSVKDNIQEAVSALVALGFKPQEASRAISQTKDESLTTEELIKEALKTKIK